MIIITADINKRAATLVERPSAQEVTGSLPVSSFLKLFRLNDS